jgi:hypothetical protein
MIWRRWGIDLQGRRRWRTGRRDWLSHSTYCIDDYRQKIERVWRC